MTAKPESVLNKKIADNLPDACVTRLESRTGLGIPDMLIALGSIFVMLENKVCPLGSKKVKLSPHQVAFHIKHSFMYAPTFIMVQHQLRTEKYKSLSLYGGNQAMELLEKGILVEPLLRYPYNAIDWAEIRERMILGQTISNPKDLRHCH
jgi:hypothetical protein